MGTLLDGDQIGLIPGYDLSFENDLPIPPEMVGWDGDSSSECPSSPDEQHSAGGRPPHRRISSGRAVRLTFSDAELLGFAIPPTPKRTRALVLAKMGGGVEDDREGGDERPRVVLPSETTKPCKELYPSSGGTSAPSTPPPPCPDHAAVEQPPVTPRRLMARDFAVTSGNIRKPSPAWRAAASASVAVNLVATVHTSPRPDHGGDDTDPTTTATSNDSLIPTVSHAPRTVVPAHKRPRTQSVSPTRCVDIDKRPRRVSQPPSLYPSPKIHPSVPVTDATPGWHQQQHLASSFALTTGTSGKLGSPLHILETLHEDHRRHHLLSAAYSPHTTGLLSNFSMPYSPPPSPYGTVNAQPSFDISGVPRAAQAPVVDGPCGSAAVAEHEMTEQVALPQDGWLSVPVALPTPVSPTAQLGGAPSPACESQPPRHGRGTSAPVTAVQHGNLLATVVVGPVPKRLTRAASAQPSSLAPAGELFLGLPEEMRSPVAQQQPQTPSPAVADAAVAPAHDPTPTPEDLGESSHAATGAAADDDALEHKETPAEQSVLNNGTGMDVVEEDIAVNETSATVVEPVVAEPAPAPSAPQRSARLAAKKARASALEEITEEADSTPAPKTSPVSAARSTRTRTGSVTKTTTTTPPVSHTRSSTRNTVKADGPKVMMASTPASYVGKEEPTLASPVRRSRRNKSKDNDEPIPPPIIENEKRRRDMTPCNQVGTYWQPHTGADSSSSPLTPLPTTTHKRAESPDPLAIDCNSTDPSLMSPPKKRSRRGKSRRSNNSSNSSNSGNTPRGSSAADKGYCDEQSAIILRYFPLPARGAGVRAMTATATECSDALVKAGFKRRTPEALIWRVRNVVWQK